MQRILILLFALVFSPIVGAAQEEPEFTDEFPIADCTFKTLGENVHFPLRMGREAHYNNFACVSAGECDESEELIITTGSATRNFMLEIDGEVKKVRTRVVEERETADGDLVEVSRNYFASCAETGDVYYFGEEVDIYEDGEIVSHDGAWLAGEDDAMPGLIMPGGAFLLGSRYFQEVAPDVALDRAEHVAAGLDIEVPAGNFEDCVEVEETTPLEAGEVSTKVYCPGTGLVIDDDLELTFITD